MKGFAAAAAALALLLAASAVSAQLDVNLSYKTLLRSSAKIGTYPFVYGQVLTEDLRPVYEINATTKGRGNSLLISNEPDFSSLVQVVGADGKPHQYSITHFESPRPGSLYALEVSQAANGTLTPKSMQYVDFAHLGGVWIPCAGSVTPWGTHLGSEEYEPDARAFAEATDLEGLKAGKSWGDVEGFMRYFNLYPNQLTFEIVKEKFNPYRYGHITEVVIQADGTASPEKWYTLGRAAWELAIVMPDQRTVYGTDDGSNVAFFKFVADVAGDLSSGRLYAARFIQTSSTSGGAFRINWIHLSHGQNDDLKDLAESTIFTDIFETAAWDSSVKACPSGFKAINAGGAPIECLKLKPGMAKAAAFLESRRYAAMKGATTEFSKWEGITYDAGRNQMYTAMSAIRYGMESNKAKGADSSKYDLPGANHIRLNYNKCGCVYRIMVDRRFNAYGMASQVCGVHNPDTSDKMNECALDDIASPDNVAYVSDLDTLLIAEDTEYHENDALWAYDMKTRTKKRILTTPYGAEVTSPYYYRNIGGYSYLVAVAQHPYEGREDKMSANGSSGWDATVGYFTWKTADLANTVGAKWTQIDAPMTDADKHKIRSTTKVTFLKRVVRALRRLL